MNRSKIKTAVILLLFVFVFALSSCNRGNMTEESVKAELERLLPLSYEMNDIFWGEGLPIMESDSKDRYITVRKDCGYVSVKEILDKAADIFSSGYLAEIKDAVFVDDDDKDPRYQEINGALKKDTYNKGFNIKGNVLIDSVAIKKQNRGMVIVSADYEDGGSLEITLVYENGKWLLNSPTY